MSKRKNGGYENETLVLEDEQVDFYRYWFEKKVVAAVSIKDNSYCVGLAFQSPKDVYNKERSRDIARARLNGKNPIILPKKYFIDSNGKSRPFFMALGKYIENSYNLCLNSKIKGISTYLINYTCRDPHIRKSVYEFIAKEYSLPYWFLYKLLKAAKKVD